MKTRPPIGQAMILAALVVALLAAPGPAAGGGAGPFCAREEVVAFVARDIRRRAPYAVLLAETIGERPSPDPAVVRCVVTIVHQDYDYVRYRSQAWMGYQEYRVRRLDRGYEVDVVKGPAGALP